MKIIELSEKVGIKPDTIRHVWTNKLVENGHAKNIGNGKKIGRYDYFESAIVYIQKNKKVGVVKTTINKIKLLATPEKNAEFRRKMTKKEIDIFDSRIYSDSPTTLQEIGDRYGISRERIRQIEKNIVKKMREFFIED